MQPTTSEEINTSQCCVLIGWNIYACRKWLNKDYISYDIAIEMPLGKNYFAHFVTGASLNDPHMNETILHDNS